MTYFRKFGVSTLGAAGAAMGNVNVSDFLSAFHIATGTGDSANTNITVTLPTGATLKPGDKIISALAWNVSASPDNDVAITDMTDELVIISSGVVQFTASTAAQAITILYVSLS